MKISIVPAFVATASIVLLGSLTVLAQAPFGGDADREFGDQLWNALEERALVGDDALMARPYEGTEPHGSILVTLDGDVEVGGESGTVIVKRNYGGQDASIDTVSDSPGDYLMAVTVMFQRQGFDPQNNDWFWAKYFPDGSYDTAPNGTALVGRAAGCISCHSEAAGDDMVYLNNRY
ncbi:MAG: cytochrome P460 family protein [Pseudohongiellaceae bacterium]